MFICLRCGFSNTRIALCLWCVWTSEDATQLFEATAPTLRRRVTISSFVSKGSGWVQRQRSPRVTIPTPPTDCTALSPTSIGKSTSCPAGRSPSQRDCNQSVSNLGSYGFRALSSLHCSNMLQCPPPFNRDNQVRSHAGSANGKYTRIRRGIPRLLYSHTKARSDSSVSPSPSSLSFTLPRFRSPSRNCASPSQGPVSSKPSNALSVAPLVVLHSPLRRARPHISQLRLQHQYTVAGIDITPSAGAGHAPPASSTALDTPQRTIRRKRRMVLLKQKSSPSLRQRASVPVLAISRASAPASSPNPGQAFRPAAAVPPPPDAPLGSWARPYYTAIRPGGLSLTAAPRPSSAALQQLRSAPPHSRSHSQPLVQTRAPHLNHAHHHSHSQSQSSPSRVPHRRGHHSYTGAPAPPFHPPGFAFGRPSLSVGCSVDGQMEQRMALARWRSAEGTPLDGSDEGEGEDGRREPRYRFRETPVPAKVKNDRGLKLGGRVKKLGMGFLELVRGRK